jgi:hypothetical protein
LVDGATQVAGDVDQLTGDAHRAGGALDGLILAAIEVVGVEVGKLDLRDLFDLAAVTEPPDSLPGFDDALATPAASRSSTAAGGVLVTKVNERSSKMVISTGMMFPGWLRSARCTPCRSP